MRLGVRGHLPFDVHLDLGDSVDNALVLQVIRAERALRQLVPAEVDVLGARAELIAEDDVVERQAEAVGHQVHAVDEDTRLIRISAS